MTRSDVLVSTDWAERNLDTDHVIFVEVDEDTGAYDTGHIPGAVKLDWKIDLQDPIKRDFVDTQQFSKLLSARGISRDDTVVLYGGNNNWFAAYAYWYFKLYGHDKIKLLDGGRKKWELDGRPHPRCYQRALEQSRQRGRDVQVRRGTRPDLRHSRPEHRSGCPGCLCGSRYAARPFAEPQAEVR